MTTTTTKNLGKIKRAEFGFGGYQDAQFGLSIELGGDDWVINDFKGFWATPWRESCEWTEETRIKRYGETVLYVSELLRAAKKMNVSELCGVPIEVITNGGCLVSWRVLVEVL